MPNYNWNSKKSEQLRKERGISFEEIIPHIDNDNLIADGQHPNKEKYPNQRMFVVRVANYVYLVPYVVNGDEIFLKTIFPSRKATRKYLGEQNE